MMSAAARCAPGDAGAIGQESRLPKNFSRYCDILYMYMSMCERRGTWYDPCGVNARWQIHCCRSSLVSH